MFCPFCHSENTKVVDKRDNSQTGVARRRRECLDCEKRFTTYERVENMPLNIEKRSGKIDAFDREKLKRSIIKALKKRPVEEEVLGELVDDIEMKLLNRKKTVIKSSEVGKMVLGRLKKIDKVAYLRYASVYKSFDSLKEFKQEIKMLETS